MSLLRSATSLSRLTRRASFNPRLRTLSTTLTRLAQGAGGGPTKASPKDASAESGGSRSKEATETGSSPSEGQVGNTGVGASPKIHDNATPSAEEEEYKKEVELHNREFEKGHDRAPPAEKDKVDNKFWSGELCCLWSMG